jgi:hypothetical protein
MLGFENYTIAMPGWANGMLGQSQDKVFQLAMPNALKYFFMANFGLSVLKFCKSKIASMYYWFKSWFNAKKYLNPSSDFFEKNQDKIPEGAGENFKRATAVIYGCGNKVGKAFARFLAEKGFNLLLIERDKESIEELKKSLKDTLNGTRMPDITEVVLERFDYAYVT